MISLVFFSNGYSQDSIPMKNIWDISLAGTLQFGNSERILLINNVNYSWLSSSRNTEFISKNRYVYGTVANNLLKENDFRSSNYLILNVKKRLNPVIGLFFQSLRIKKVNSIYKPMLGAQYKLVENEKFMFTPNVLIGYIWQNYKARNFIDFDNNGEDNINGTNFNLGFNASAKLFDNKLSVTMFSIYQIGIEETKHQRFWFDININIPLYKGLYARATFNNYFENIVLQGVKQNDINIGYGLGVKF